MMPAFTTPQNIRIFYDTWGDPTHPPLILIHGLGSNSRIWEPQIADFSRDYYVIAFDFPGHGQSERKGPYNYDVISAIVGELMDHLGVADAHLCALSVGCNVALGFAVMQPQRVRSLVLQGPSGGIWPLWHPFGWIKAVLITVYLALLGVLYPFLGMDRLVWLINRFGPQTHRYYELLDSVEREFSPWCYPALAYRNACPPYHGKLGGVNLPGLIVRGRSDGFPRRYYAYIQDHVQAAWPLFEIPDARHVAAVEQPEIFNAAVLDFLRKVEPLAQAPPSAFGTASAAQSG